MEDLDRTCINCNDCFAPVCDGDEQYGVCLNKLEFEPYIDEMIETGSTSCCKNLFESMMFDANREACSDFSSVEIIYEQPFDAEAYLSEAKSATVNDELVSVLKGTDKELKDRALSVLFKYVYLGNKNAYDVLFEYFCNMPRISCIEDTHTKTEILEVLERYTPKEVLIPILFKQLYDTPSNNTTRQWFTAIFEFIKSCKYDEVHEHLMKMLYSDKFSYKIKRRVEDILDRLEYKQLGAPFNPFR